jgi:two-component system, OmpR family, response regulator
MPGAQKTVLIIDDEALVRELYSVKLKRDGFSVREADGGAAGLADAFAHKPDLIVLDLLMPDPNGFEVLKKLRADAQWGARVPVVVLTNDKLEKDEELQMIEAMTPAYILMKISATPEDLAAVVRGVLE